MIETIEMYFLLFMSYAVLGWCMEVVCKLIELKRFVNRGFLVGPYCPIYGWGALLITLLLKRYVADPSVLFIFCIIICSILEYLTSYILEKVFHARWWDYSNKKFNINGRICLNTMVPFGLLGLTIIYLINPCFMKIYNMIDINTIHIISITLLIIFLIDNIVSTNILFNIRGEIKVLDKDYTEDMARKVKEKIMGYSWIYKRVLNAFPDVKHIRGLLIDVIKREKIKLKEEKRKLKELRKKALK